MRLRKELRKRFTEAFVAKKDSLLKKACGMFTFITCQTNTPAFLFQGSLNSVKVTLFPPCAIFNLTLHLYLKVM